MKQKIIYQLSVSSSLDVPRIKEAVKEAFLSHGFKDEEIVEEADRISNRISVFQSESAALRKISKYFKSIKIPAKIVIKKLKPQDWQDGWKKNFKPFSLTRSLKIIPIWMRKSHAKLNASVIYMDTSLAFGTGLHETTRFMSRFIESVQGRYESFLDIGTGTGILSMVAQRGGARRILAVDYDQNSMQVALENFKNNRSQGIELKKTDIQKWSSREGFDFVAANLVSYDLIQFKEKILRFIKPGGFLAVSGISLKNFRKVSSAYRSLPLKLLKIFKGKEWAAMLYQRKTI